MKLIDEIFLELKKLPPDAVVMLCAILLHTYSQWNWQELLNELKQLGVPNDRS